MNAEVTPTPTQQVSSGSRFAAATQILNDAIAARAFPGCAFGVLADGKVQIQDALGHFTYEEASPAVTAETVYDLASVTKVVATTAVAMLLYQRGLLDIDTLLGDLLPGFVTGRAVGGRARHVTLRHLLAHNSGLPGYVEFFRAKTTPSELFRACLQLPLEAEPGTRSEYSDPGFILLGKALELSIPEPPLPWIQRELFQLFQMASTGYSPAPDKRSLIPPTEEDTTFRHRRIQGEVQDENAWLLKGIAGHAGLFSNVPDLLRFAAGILNSSLGKVPPANNARLFNAETVKVFAERQGPAGSSRALGWDTPSQNSSSGRHFSANSIGHLGFSGCSLWIDLDAGVAIVLLTNRTWPDRKNQMIREIRPVFHDAVREAL
jgi:CubicO group peptidase (beta-lactamase class C family)